MSTGKCPNCDTPIAETFKHCPNCGQSQSLHRFNLRHFFEEIFHAFTHTDKGALLLVKELVLRPSVVLREYIVERKRKKYFNPFTLLLLVLGLTVFMSSIFHPMKNSASVYQEKIATADTQEKKAIMQTIAEKQERINQFMEKKMNVVVFITAPFMALAFWLVFKGKGFNYAEHLVAYLILTSLLSLISSVFFLPMMAYLPFDKVYLVVMANILIQFVYTTYAYSGFLKLKGIGEKMMVIAANILGMGLWLLVLMLITFVYILLF